MNLYDKLKLLRTLNGFTQQEIADKFFISRQAVQKWECGETAPDISKLHDLSSIYGLSVDDLLNTHLDEKSIKTLVLQPNINFHQEDLAILNILKNPSGIDYLILALIIISTGFVLVLLHLFGTIFVIINFLAFLFLCTSSIYFTINLIFNIHNGISVFLMNIGFTLISFSSSYIVYLFFFWMLKTYTTLVKTISNRFKEYNLLKVLVFNEKER